MKAFFATSSLRPMLGVLLLAVALAGCRGYGRYGNEAATLAAIQQTNQLFAEALERARGELASLERAGAANEVLGTAALAYAAIVEQHELVLAAHRLLAEDLDDDDYRALHRAYGAIISDQQIIKDHYAEVLAGLQQAAGETSMAGTTLQSRWQAVPPFYERIRYATTPALPDLIGQVQQGAAAPPDTSGVPAN